MLNFKNISPNADFYSKLDIVNKNLLYTTHMCDKILKILKKLETNSGLQQQVDKYFEDDSRDIPDEDKEPD